MRPDGLKPWTSKPYRYSKPGCPLVSSAEVGIPWSRAAYAEDYARLMAQELPYYQQAGTCGHCGASDTLDDAAWVDFRSYIQWKAISRQLTGYRSTSAPAYWEAMHAPMPTNDVEVDPSQTGEHTRTFRFIHPSSPTTSFALRSRQPKSIWLPAALLGRQPGQKHSNYNSWYKYQKGQNVKTCGWLNSAGMRLRLCRPAITLHFYSLLMVRPHGWKFGLHCGRIPEG